MLGRVGQPLVVGFEVRPAPQQHLPPPDRRRRRSSPSDQPSASSCGRSNGGLDAISSTAAMLTDDHLLPWPFHTTHPP
ncbi:MAG: hypothetical protein L0H64_07265, partial [Pseudonocardia sp.]|nr:hypothetical protein [Pseudonocardia sp.]